LHIAIFNEAQPGQNIDRIQTARSPKELIRQASKMDKLILLGTIKFSALYIRQSFRAYSTVAH